MTPAGPANVMARLAKAMAGPANVMARLAKAMAGPANVAARLAKAMAGLANVMARPPEAMAGPPGVSARRPARRARFSAQPSVSSFVFAARIASRASSSARSFIGIPACPFTYTSRACGLFARSALVFAISS